MLEDSMSITFKKTHGHKYVYFQAGPEKTIYLGHAEDPSKVNVEKVGEALGYLKDRTENYARMEAALLSLIPAGEREAYISGKFASLHEMCKTARGAPDLSRYDNQGKGRRNRARDEILQSILPEDLAAKD